ncbi:MAG: hypothetical protein HN441_04125 [Candidatus Thioglobus sp.]|nr:hypothetical protein [Candidatus Thioglobus sp.]
MKKQLLIAAVAATMGTAAIADISITGSAKVNYTQTDNALSTSQDTDKVSNEMDLKVKGTNGDTAVVINFGAMDGGDNGSTTDSVMDVEDTYLTTTVAGISIKTGQYDNGNNLMRASSRNAGRFSASKEISGVTVGFFAGNADDEEVSASTTISGVKVSAKAIAGGNGGEEYKVSGDLAGVTYAYHTNRSNTADSDRTTLRLDTTVAGVTLTYAQAEADTAAVIDGDSWFGDFEGNTTGNMDANVGDDIKGFGAKMALAGNTVQVRHVEVDSDTANEGLDINKLIVTRALANSTTFELTYTDEDSENVADADKATLDLELAVKF